MASVRLCVLLCAPKSGLFKYLFMCSFKYFLMCILCAPKSGLFKYLLIGVFMCFIIGVCLCVSIWVFICAPKWVYLNILTLFFYKCVWLKSQTNKYK